jgi:hypothetical protein
MTYRSEVDWAAAKNVPPVLLRNTSGNPRLPLPVATAYSDRCSESTVPPCGCGPRESSGCNRGDSYDVTFVKHIHHTGRDKKTIE